jgi:hypothetical protein
MTISATTQGLKPGVCTSSNRPANPFDGMVIYETDTDKIAVYDSSAWVYKTGTTAPTAPGLVLVATATATAVQTLSINDCFSSAYAAYEIEIINTDSVGANVGFTARLRVGGTDTTTQYVSQAIYGYSTTIGTNNNFFGSDEWYVSELDPTNKGYFTKMTLHNPNVATKTTGRVLSNYSNSSVGLVILSIALVQDSTTQFTGITFITAGTSFTGTIRVYGYANS